MSGRTLAANLGSKVEPVGAPGAAMPGRRAGTLTKAVAWLGVFTLLAWACSSTFTQVIVEESGSVVLNKTEDAGVIVEESGSAVLNKTEDTGAPQESGSVAVETTTTVGRRRWEKNAERVSLFCCGILVCTSVKSFLALNAMSAASASTVPAWLIALSGGAATKLLFAAHLGPPGIAAALLFGCVKLGGAGHAATHTAAVLASAVDSAIFAGLAGAAALYFHFDLASQQPHAY